MPSEHLPVLRRGARAAWAAAVGALFVAACSTSPASTSERSVTETPDPSETTATTVAPTTEPPTRPTLGELRAELHGQGTEEAPEHVLLVGDSVLVLVADDVASRLSSTLHVDAADCRRIDTAVPGPCGGVPSGGFVSHGIDTIESNMRELAVVGIVPEVAVVILANNSSLERRHLDAAMAELAGVDRVWWVTTRIAGFGRQDPNNRLLAELAADDPRARVIDWYAASEDQDWIADHVHPNDAGQVALGALVADHVRCDCVP